VNFFSLSVNRLFTLSNSNRLDSHFAASEASVFVLRVVLAYKSVLMPMMDMPMIHHIPIYPFSAFALTGTKQRLFKILLD